MIDDRRDVSHLQQLCPDEANNYHHLVQEANAVPGDTMTGAVQEQMLKRRAKAIKELEECIERIRAVPGLQRFLLALSAKQLQQQAHAGPIIVVNVTDIRSDAIIIEQSCIRLVKFPIFSAEGLRAWKRQDLTEFSGATLGKMNKKYRKFLIWIWESRVQTVVDRLNQDSASGYAAGLSRRVWWIGVGEASTIPFHAAGDHSPGRLDNTFSHVVSSYTPTIKALEFARERLTQSRPALVASAGETAMRKLCVVTMPHTPGKSDLLGVASESASIQDIAKSAFSITSLPRPTAAQVKEQLQSCHIFHFAGHGTANATDPSRGCLVLQKYDESGTVLVPDLLSVSDVSQLRSAHAQLAYLSACSTAENSTRLLADEVIHLVSGFQVAGFAHVIGSMWPSADQICVDVARMFYQTVCAKSEELDADGSAAHALHSAVLEIRKQLPMEPLQWAQFVHFGA